jgi:hypothetical protein
MQLVRRQPHGVDGGYHPDRVFHAHRQQTAQRAEQLAARVAVRLGGQLLILAAHGRDQHGTIGTVHMTDQFKNGIGHGVYELFIG